MLVVAGAALLGVLGLFKVAMDRFNNQSKKANQYREYLARYQPPEEPLPEPPTVELADDSDTELRQ